MGALDDLIKIKTSKQDDDLIKVIEEISIYEKLSVDKKLRDLKTSEVTRKKCPLLAGFMDGNLYEMVLMDLMANVYLQIEGSVPEVLNGITEQSEKKQKQISILQAGITRVTYRDLTEYDHESMAKLVSAVFVNRVGTAATAVIITKSASGFVMYHGAYTTSADEQPIGMAYEPIAVTGTRGSFTLFSYSVLGNNGYRFGKYQSADASYDVMLSPEGMLYLIDGTRTLPFALEWAARGELVREKGDPKSFAAEMVKIIEGLV